MSKAKEFHYSKDADGIVTITMDMNGPVNAMNAEYRAAMKSAVDKLQAEAGLTGVIIASAKKVFFAGADLHELLAAKPGDEEEFMAMVTLIKAQFRILEQLPVPVVAAINGAALGGGFEICLACNYRIALDDRSIQLGLPEVTLGLLPGGGGIVRMVNMLGVEAALPYLLEGKKCDPQQALKAGLINETVETLGLLIPRAKAYILEQRNNPLAAQQPWDDKTYKIPGGKAGSPKLAQLIAIAPAMLQQKTRGLLPAPEEILDVAIEATRLDFDTAMRVESRAMTRLLMTPEAKNMITTFFFQLNKINAGASRPENVAPSAVKKLGVLGAGMMGQGIAYTSAKAGIEVVLKDISLAAAEKGKAYSAQLLDKAIARGRCDEAKKAAHLNRIQCTENDTDLQGCDLIIEAVFESLELKNKMTKTAEKYLAENGIWGSNTSSLPITQLAKASSRPENFIGIHFFSPVDKMPLVEIICGEKTCDETLARAFDFVRQIKKTPIVVNDSLAFFTSRTFSTYLDEAARLVSEGVHPVRVDNLGKATGMPVGPLTVHDEVSQELTRKIHETWTAMGVAGALGEQDTMHQLIQWMVVENKRGGRHYQGGYYDYAASGEKTLWPGLVEKYYCSETLISDSDIKDRLFFRQVIETLKCLETKVLRSVADGNIGSIMGIGAPVHTGGFLQFINTYGLEQFSQRCAALASRYGERFSCPAIVAEKLKAKTLFT